jgi:xanthine dehydrogenase small subunit
VRVPLPPAAATSTGVARYVASYKIAKRFDQDISAVCAGFVFDVEGGRIAAARIAYGGMAAIPKRAVNCEAALTGGPWSEAALDGATAALARDFEPISDMRASGRYRLRIAANLLRRFYAECAAPGQPSRIGAAPLHSTAG